jgi:hypothetical protein
MRACRKKLRILHRSIPNLPGGRAWYRRSCAEIAILACLPYMTAPRCSFDTLTIAIHGISRALSKSTLLNVERVCRTLQRSYYSYLSTQPPSSPRSPPEPPCWNTQMPLRIQQFPLHNNRSRYARTSPSPIGGETRLCRATMVLKGGVPIDYRLIIFVNVIQLSDPNDKQPCGGLKNSGATAPSSHLKQTNRVPSYNNQPQSTNSRFRQKHQAKTTTIPRHVFPSFIHSLTPCIHIYIHIRSHATCLPAAPVHNPAGHRSPTIHVGIDPRLTSRSAGGRRRS